MKFRASTSRSYEVPLAEIVRRDTCLAKRRDNEAHFLRIIPRISFLFETRPSNFLFFVSRKLIPFTFTVHHFITWSFNEEHKNKFTYTAKLEKLADKKDISYIEYISKLTLCKFVNSKKCNFNPLWCHTSHDILKIFIATIYCTRNNKIYAVSHF